ncbi:esterase/lipase family protein [Amycolatopsis azurea]|uniref:esterase/lipase family protein n=1 Tax=Amycolatopsis azurea TaxID=36819 RepID=UPI0038165615
MVLVHGGGVNALVSWALAAPQLESQGYCVFTPDYGVPAGTPWPLSLVGGRTKLEQAAAEIGVYVDRVLSATRSSKVDIVGHSLGTVVPGYYAKFLGGADKIDHYISLAPAWHGVDGPADVAVALARKLGLGPLIDGVTDVVWPDATQLLAHSEFIRRLNDGGAAMPHIKYTNITTRYDLFVVPHTNGFLDAPNATNFVIQDQCPLDLTEHVLMAYSASALRLVSNALDPANAKPPC